MNGSENPKLLSFVEAPVFSEQLAELAGARQMDLLYAIQDELLADPERGDLVKGLINQALREIISGKIPSAVPMDDRSEALAERIAQKFAARLDRSQKKKAA
jgi:hypothetical protein